MEGVYQYDWVWTRTSWKPINHVAASAAAAAAAAAEYSICNSGYPLRPSPRATWCRQLMRCIVIQWWRAGRRRIVSLLILWRKSYLISLTTGQRKRLMDKMWCLLSTAFWTQRWWRLVPDVSHRIHIFSLGSSHRAMMTSLKVDRIAVGCQRERMLLLCSAQR